MKYQVTAVNPRTNEEKVVIVAISEDDTKCGRLFFCHCGTGHYMEARITRAINRQMPDGFLMLGNSLRYLQ